MTVIPAPKERAQANAGIQVLYRFRDGFYFDVGFRAHTAGSFLLRGQKKRTKEKAARMTCPANNAGFPALLTRFGAQPNSHKKRAQTWLRLTQSGLRCSAASYGMKVKTGGFVVNGVGCSVFVDVGWA